MSAPVPKTISKALRDVANSAKTYISGTTPPLNSSAYTSTYPPNSTNSGGFSATSTAALTGIGSLSPGSLVWQTGTSSQPNVWTSWGTSQPYVTTLARDVSPYVDDGSLTEQDYALIKEFKTRHPDFNTYLGEMGLITIRKPGLLNTTLFLPLIYELAKDIRKLIDSSFDDEKVEEVLDGSTP